MMAKMVMEDFSGVLPEKHDQLTRLPGVGRKTANVVLSELGIDARIAVDTHVFRVSRRLGLSEGASPLQVEEDLMRQFQKTDWRHLHHFLILHGRRVCIARAPKCSSCAVQSLCKYAQGFPS
jgi:endonuclease-3